MRGAISGRSTFGYHATVEDRNLYCAGFTAVCAAVLADLSSTVLGVDESVSVLDSAKHRDTDSTWRFWRGIGLLGQILARTKALLLRRWGQRCGDCDDQGNALAKPAFASAYGFHFE